MTLRAAVHHRLVWLLAGVKVVSVGHRLPFHQHPGITKNTPHLIRALSRNLLADLFINLEIARKDVVFQGFLRHTPLFALGDIA